jgi:hypothetical protein
VVGLAGIVSMEPILGEMELLDRVFGVETDAVLVQAVMSA